jgi:hypothetical protein
VNFAPGGVQPLPWEREYMQAGRGFRSPHSAPKGGHHDFPGRTAQRAQASRTCMAAHLLPILLTSAPSTQEVAAPQSSKGQMEAIKAGFHVKHRMEAGKAAAAKPAWYVSSTDFCPSKRRPSPSNLQHPHLHLHPSFGHWMVRLGTTKEYWSSNGRTSV